MHVLFLLGLGYLNLIYFLSMVGATKLKSTYEVFTFIFTKKKTNKLDHVQVL